MPVQSFEDFLSAPDVEPKVQSFEDFLSTAGPKTDLGTGALEKPLVLPRDNFPHPPIGPQTMAPPPSAESMQAAVGPFTPAPTQSPFNLPIQQIRKPVQSQGPIGALPQVSNPIDVAPPPQKQAPMQPVPSGATVYTNGNPNMNDGANPPAAGQPPAVPGLNAPGPTPSLAQRIGLESSTAQAPASVYQPGDRDKSIAVPAQNKAVDEALADPQMAAVLRSAWQGFADQIPNAKTPSEAVQNGVARAALGLISPKALATMLAAEGAVAIVSSAVNSARGVALISQIGGDAAKVRQAVDIAAREAVPAAFATQSVVAGTQAAVAAYNEPDPVKRAEKAVEAVTNIALGAAGAYGMHQGAKATAELHPPADIPQTAYEGAPAMPSAETKAQAPGMAQAMEQSGNRLAAQSWRDISQWGSTLDKPISFKAGDQTLTIVPQGPVQSGPPSIKGKYTFQVVNEEGKVLTAGTADTVRGWLDMNTAQKQGNPESSTSITSQGPQPAIEQTITGAPSRPISGAFRDEDAMYQQAVDLANSVPSFGTKKLRDTTGANLDETTRILQRLVDDGIAVRTQNGKGAVVYHAVPKQSGAPASDEEKQLDSLLGNKPSTTVNIGGQEYTIESVPTNGKVGEHYKITGPDGEVVADAGIRKPTVAKWLGQALAGAQNNPPAEPPQQEQPSNNIQAPPSAEELPAPASNAYAEPAQSPAQNAGQPEESTAVEKPVENSAPVTHPPTFEEFLDHPEDRKFSSTQVNLPDKESKIAVAAATAIPASELAEDGAENHPHVTVLYGLHDQNPEAVTKLLADEGPVTGTVGKVSIFKNDKFDVVKLDFDSPDFGRLNSKLATLPHTNDHPVFQPHITLGYVKPGMGDKYVGKSIPGLTGKTLTFNNLTHSSLNGMKTEIPLTGQGAATDGQTSTNEQDVHKPETEPEIKTSETAPQFPVQNPEPEVKAPPSAEHPSTAAPVAVSPEAPPSAEEPTQQPIQQPAASEEGLLPGTEKLVNLVAKRLELPGHPLGDNIAFQKAARDSFGEVSVSPRDKYDALEAGVNRFLQNHAGEFWNAEGNSGIRALHAVEDKLPTQTTRTEEQIKEQQFSTPPSLALLSAKVLAPTKEDTVLEPSAGTGNLLVWPRHVGARVVANELAPRRAALLKLLGTPDVYSVDARHLHDVLPDNVQPTAILMNPPFSMDSRAGKHDTSVGIDHVEQALGRLAPGGRLVAILGTKQGDVTAPKVTRRWEAISKKYNIRASVEIDGEAYRKYGTTFGNSVVVIDKTGATPGATWNEKIDNIVRGQFKTPEDAWNALKPIADDRNAPESPKGAESGGSVGQVRAGSPAAQPGGSNGVRSGSGVGERGSTAGGPGIPAESRPSESAGNPPRERPGTEPGSGEPGETRPGGTVQPSAPSIRVDEPEDTTTKARDRKEEGSFVAYQPQRLPDSWGAQPHQANIVETQSMAAMTPPPITKKPNIPWDLVNSGAISEVQLEAVAYAIKAHEQFLPSGERVGFYAGDGTGLGKGREIAATILHYWNSGARRIIWVSFSTDLKEDAERDLKDLGASHIPVKLINDFKVSSDITMGDGVVFTTFNSLSSGKVQKDEKGAKSGPKAFHRMDQLAKWGGDEPVIIFDEAHKAKNSTEERGSRGRQKASDSGLATVGVQSKIPKARVVYSSATGATDVRNLGYATRLGLWGVGSSFDTFDDFRNAISGGGVGAMEVVARDLKAQGRYLSRFISFEGVEYREKTHELTNNQIELYNVAAKAWQTVFQNFNKALEVTEGGGMAKMAAMSAFWGANQRFFRQFVTSLKMPTLLREVHAARDANKSVVISLMGTGAAQADRELARLKEEEGSLDDMDVSAADVLLKLIEKSFPTIKYTDSVDDRGNPTKVMMLDAEGRPVESKEALELKDELLHKLQGLRFPDHPIDQIINEFGHENVAELTGRKNQFLTNKDGRKEVHRRKKEGIPMDKTNISEARDFQSGKKHIAVISAAASTGISLHADKRAKNQERRVHIVLETKWSADTQMQDFGRTHRTNQVVPPEYVLLSSNVGGEKRFLSTIARRLAQLGALTRGQRDAATSGDLAKYNFESEYGTSAVQATLDAMARQREASLGFEGDQALVDMGLIKELKDAREANFQTATVPNFLNRTFSLEPDRQDKVFGLFIRNFEAAVTAAKNNGTFDEGVEDIKSPSIKLKEPERTVHTQPATGAKTIYYNLDQGFVPGRMPFERAEGVASADSGLGFRRQRDSGNIYAFQESLSQETDSEGNMHPQVRIYTVRGAQRLVRESDMAQKYEKITPATAREWWDPEVAKIPKIDFQPLHVIGGSIMPVWNVLQGGERGLKTVRVKTDDGQYIIGAKIANANINRVLRGLGAEGSVKMDAADVMKIVMEDGDTIDLAGELKLRRIKLSGEKRMEVLNVPYNQEKTVQSLGVSKEYVDHRQRYFVNLHDENALPAILEKYPVVGSSTGAQLPVTRGSSERGSFSTKAMPTKDDYKRVELYRRVKQVLKADKGATGRAELLLAAHGEDPAVIDTIDRDFLTPVQQAIYNKEPGKAVTMVGTPELSRYRNRKRYTALQTASNDPQAKGFGEALRLATVGERNVRIAETNQLRQSLRKLLPKTIDQEGLSLYRDFKNRPGEMREFLDGTHADLKKLKPAEKAAAQLQLNKIEPVIERALNPTAAMLDADKQLTAHFKTALKEGKDLGFLESSYSNSEYITHLLQPRGADNNPRAAGMSKAMSSTISRYFQFGNERMYPTLLHAIASGLRPRTLNALDAMAIHGEKHAANVATRLLINYLRNSGMGLWGGRASGNVPAGWVELASHSHTFRNNRAWNDDQGEAHSGYQSLFVPKEIDDALAPITDLNGMNKVYGFQKLRSYQGYLKAVQLGLSLFHLRAMNITAYNNMGARGLLEALLKSSDDPDFQEQERNFIRAGGLTALLGQILEAYRGLEPSAIPTRLDMLRGLPGIKQADAVARLVTKLTFDVVQRKFKVVDFAIKDAAWIAKNPTASAEEHAAARSSIAKEINAAYGGLNWEGMGINKPTLEVARAFMLAPDWTFSNVINAKYAFEGGPGGKAARMFWIKSAVTGLVLTAAMSILLGGRLSPNPTNVYMGQDDQGRDVYQNMFFAGAPSDVVNLINNVADFGAPFGLAHSMASKMGPIPRTAIGALTNRNWLGQPIIPSTEALDDYEVLGHQLPNLPAPVLKSLIGTGWLATQAFPIPFSISNGLSMLLDPDRTYSMKEYATTLLGGTRPRHVSQ